MTQIEISTDEPSTLQNDKPVTMTCETVLEIFFKALLSNHDDKLILSIFDRYCELQLALAEQAKEVSIMAIKANIEVSHDLKQTLQTYLKELVTK